MISAVVVGNLGQDADLKYTNDGTPVLNLSVASNTRRKEDGQWVKATDWVRATLFGERGTKLVEFLTKGTTVAVRGALSVREYDKRDGSRGFSIEMRVDDVEMFGGKREGESEPRRSAPPPAGTRSRAPTPQAAPPPETDPNDDLPF